MLSSFILTVLIVGFVTAGLNIKFDRFFTILLLFFFFKFNIDKSIDIFLWVIMLGALVVLLKNKASIAKISRKKKKKLFILIPIFTAIASFFGTVLFFYVSSSVLIVVLGILALLYGGRLVFIHFQKYELEFEKGHPVITNICGLLGPWISGFSIGFIGTSLKPLKIPFAIKVGRMNIKQVYLGNTVTAFFASVFAIIWHYIFASALTVAIFYQNMLLGIALWAGIHIVFELTNLVFRDKWRKGFQVLIGILLMLASIKVFVLM